MPFPGDLLPPADDNPEGYWEAREIVSLNNEMLETLGLDWKSLDPISAADFDRLVNKYGEEATARLKELAQKAGGSDFAIKDPRLSRLLPVWIQAARQTDLEAELFATVRDAAGVALSLYRRRRDRRFLPAAIDVPDTAILLWLRYMLDLEAHSRAVPRQFIAFANIANLTAIPPTPEACQRAVSPARDDEALGDEDAVWSEISSDVRTILETGRVEHERERLDRWRLSLGSAEETGRLEESNGHSARQHALASFFVTAPLTGRIRGPVIAFVSGEPTGRGHIYRIENRITSLIGEPAGVLRVDPKQADAGDVIAASDMVLMFRMPMDAWSERLLSKAHQSGLPVVYDIDDLIFDPAYMTPDFFRFLAGKPAEMTTTWQEKAMRYREAAEAAHGCWVPTEPLAEHMRRFNRSVTVLPNGLSDHALRAPSTDRFKPARSEKPIIIGYASGTPTHDRDFEEIGDVIAAVLERDIHVHFRVLGHLDGPAVAKLRRFGARFERRPAVDYFALSSELSAFDVSIAPLEATNPFCQCKSELKFFEAGAVTVPTVASATPPFQACIRQGLDGYVAFDQQDWREALVRLTADPTHRGQTGRDAQNRAFELFGPGAQKTAFLNVLGAWLPSLSPTRTERGDATRTA